MSYVRWPGPTGFALARRAEFNRAYAWTNNVPFTMVNNNVRYSLYGCGNWGWNPNRMFFGGPAWGPAWGWRANSFAAALNTWNAVALGETWAAGNAYDWRSAYAARFPPPVVVPYAPPLVCSRPVVYAAPQVLDGPEAALLQQMLNSGAVSTDQGKIRGPHVIKPNNMSDVLARVERGAGVVLTLPDGATALAKNPVALQQVLEGILARQAAAVRTASAQAVVPAPPTPQTTPSSKPDASPPSSPKPPNS
jgi:hypothetical protein